MLNEMLNEMKILIKNFSWLLIRTRVENIFTSNENWLWGGDLKYLQFREFVESREVGAWKGYQILNGIHREGD